MRKKNILLDLESIIELMQEVYTDVTEQKNNSTIIMKKMNSFMKTSDDLTILGPIIKDQQKILNDCIEKKLSLLKLQAALIKSNPKKVNEINNSGRLELTDEEKHLLDKLIKDE